MNEDLGRFYLIAFAMNDDLSRRFMIFEKLFRVCVIPPGAPPTLRVGQGVRRAVCAEESLARNGYVAVSARDASLRSAHLHPLRAVRCDNIQIILLILIIRGALGLAREVEGDGGGGEDSARGVGWINDNHGEHGAHGVGKGHCERFVRSNLIHFDRMFPKKK